MGFLTTFKKAWRGIQVDDNNDRKTRFIMTVWSFMLLSSIMTACFTAALCVKDASIRLALIDLIKHLSYVFGGLIASYHGVESFFPSEARNYSGLGGFAAPQEVKVDPKKDPPTHPSSDDLDDQ